MFVHSKNNENNKEGFKMKAKTHYSFLILAQLCLFLVLLVVIIEQINLKFSGLNNCFMVLCVLWVKDSGRAWPLLLLVVLTEVSLLHTPGEWAGLEGPGRLCFRAMRLGRVG